MKQDENDRLRAGTLSGDESEGLSPVMPGDGASLSIPRMEWPAPATREALIEAGKKAIEWLLEPVLVRATIVLLIGMPKAGKSELALAIAVALVRGVWPWGEWMIPRAVSVGIFAFEDSLRRLGRRLARYGIKEAWPLVWPRGHVPPVVLPRDEKRLIEFIKQHSLDVLIIDVLLYTIGNADENSAGEMQPWCAALGRIVETTNCTIIVLHHTRKRPAGKPDATDDVREAGRGSTAIKAAADLIVGGHRKDELLTIRLAGKDDQEGEYVVTFARGASDLGELWTVERANLAEQSSREGNILAAIRGGKGRSLSTIAEATGISRSVVGRIVSDLKEKGRVADKPGGGYDAK